MPSNKPSVTCVNPGCNVKIELPEGTILPEKYRVTCNADGTHSIHGIDAEGNETVIV